MLVKENWSQVKGYNYYNIYASGIGNKFLKHFLAASQAARDFSSTVPNISGKANLDENFYFTKIDYTDRYYQFKGIRRMV